MNRNGPTELKIDARSCENLIILVENQGRINAGRKMTDPKGMIKNVTLNKEILANWEVAPFLPMTFSESNKMELFDNDDPQGVYIGSIPRLQTPQDSYLLLKGWSKVYISFHLYVSLLTQLFKNYSNRGKPFSNNVLLIFLLP